VPPTFLELFCGVQTVFGTDIKVFEALVFFFDFPCLVSNFPLDSSDLNILSGVFFSLRSPECIPASFPRPPVLFARLQFLRLPGNASGGSAPR